MPADISPRKWPTLDDYRLAHELARRVVLSGSDDTIPVAWDENQAHDGFSFEVGRHPGAASWQRYEGYKAKDWDAVKARITYLIADPSFLDSLR